MASGKPHLDSVPERVAGAVDGRDHYLAIVQADRSPAGLLYSVAQSLRRNADHPVRNVRPVIKNMRPRKDRRTAVMKWLKTIVRLWKGELLKEEIEKSQKTMDDARQAVTDTRAMLDGEDSWLIREWRRHDQWAPRNK